MVDATNLNFAGKGYDIKYGKGNSMQKKIIDAKSSSEIKNQGLPSFDKQYALKREEVQRKFAGKPREIASRLSDLFREELNLVNNIDQLDKLVTLYVEKIPYSIESPEEKSNYERLKDLPYDKKVGDSWTRSIWSNLTLYKQFVYKDAIEKIRNLDAKLKTPKGLELFRKYHPFIVDDNL